MALLLHKQQVAIHLGTTSIEIAGMKTVGKKKRLTFYDVVDLVADHSITAPEEITDGLYVDKLRALSAKYDLRRSHILTALPVDSAVIRIVDIDAEEPEEDLLSILQEELEQISAQPLEDMEVACHQLEPEEGTATAKIPLLACAVPTDELARHRRIFRESGLSPSVVDLDAFGIYNALCYFINKQITAPVTMVHIGAVYTVCMIVFPGKNPFFYVVEVGGNDITSAIVDETGLPLFRAASFAKKMLKRRWTQRDDLAESPLSTVHLNFAERLITEVKKCIRHYQSSQGVTEIHGIYLTGGCAPLDFLLDEFNKRLSFQTKLWDPLQFFRSRNEADDDVDRPSIGYHLGPVLGTLLRGV